MLRRPQCLAQPVSLGVVETWFAAAGMLFCQLGSVNSLRDIANGLAASEAKLRHKVRFKNKLLSIDATTIELCASVFDWALFRRTKAGVITEGKRHEGIQD